MKPVLNRAFWASCLLSTVFGAPRVMAAENVQPAGIKAVVEEPAVKNGASPIVECSMGKDIWREVGRLCHAAPTERRLASCEDVAKNSGMTAEDMAAFCKH